MRKGGFSSRVTQSTQAAPLRPAQPGLYVCHSPAAAARRRRGASGSGTEAPSRSMPMNPTTTSCSALTVRWPCTPRGVSSSAPGMTCRAGRGELLPPRLRRGPRRPATVCSILVCGIPVALLGRLRRSRRCRRRRRCLGGRARVPHARHAGRSPRVVRRRTRRRCRQAARLPRLPPRDASESGGPPSLFMRIRCVPDLMRCMSLGSGAAQGGSSSSKEESSCEGLG